MNKKWRKSLQLFPNFVSENPKKMIVMIVIFTIIMGFFASQMSMETEEESFNPDTKRAQYLDTIQQNFGSSGEAVQIAFVAENSDVFTDEVLLDMINSKIAFIENDKINKTLVSSNENPSGITTLADSILYANQTLKMSDYLIEYSDHSQGLLFTFQNQTEMYESMDQSLSACSYLIGQSNPVLYQNGINALVSMSTIISEPQHWMVLQNYYNGIMNLTYVLSTGNTNQKILYLNDIINKLSSSPLPYNEPFIGLFNSTKNILESSQNPQVQETSIGMTLSFLNIGTKISSLDTDQQFNEPMPDLELSLNEKKQMLESMDDSDIKNTIQETLNFNPEEINKSIGTAISNFQHITNQAEMGIQTLENLNQTLTYLYTNLSSKSSQSVLMSIGEYQQSVIINKTILSQSKSVFSETSSRFKSAYFLPSVVEGISRSLKMIVSEDFDYNGSINSIQAKSSIGLVQMNSSINRDIRLEAQNEVIKVSKEECKNSQPRVFAGQVMMEEINESANNSMNTLLPIAFVFVVVVLLIIYRAITETILSIMSLGIAIVWTFGIGVILGYSFNPMIIAVPILITGLVIDYGIHMVMRIREERKENENPSDSTKIAILTVGGALLLTTMTTAIGFLSNTFSNIEVMQQFGILAAVGITSSFVLMVGFLPAVIQLVEDWREEKESKKGRGMAKDVKEKGADIISSILSGATDASDKHPWVVLVIVLLLTSSAAYGVVNIDTTFNIQDFLPEDKQQSKNIEYMSSNFNISTSYAFVLVEGDLDNSEFLHSTDEVIGNMQDDEMLRADEGVSSPLSVLQNFGTATSGSQNYNSTIVQAFSDSDTDGDLIPEQNITDLYDMLFSYKQSRNSIRSVLLKDSGNGYSMGVLKVKENAEKLTTNMDNAEILRKDLEDDVKPIEDIGITAKVTSSSIIGQETTDELSSTQLRSLIATIFIVGILLTIVFYFVHESKVLGIITTLPVTVVTIWIIGTMYLMDVPLNVMTVSITALTVGMGVDYSIHITHRFTEEKEEEDNLYDAMHDTVQNTGAALFGSAVTTMGAFGILSTSDILPLAQFGYITALAIGYSLLVAVFVLPSGLMLWAKCCKPEQKGKESKSKKDLPVLKKR